jgi:CHRD domain
MDLVDGKWYFNLGTAANPGGEIRGQILRSDGIYGDRIRVASEITAIRMLSPYLVPNGSAPVPFVIPSEAEGSAVQSFGCNELVIPTGA